MSRAVANTLLPAARPASTIARPRPRELPVTNHTCAIHPPLSSPPDILKKLLKLRIGCAMGYTKGLVSYGGSRRIFRPQRMRSSPFFTNAQNAAFNWSSGNSSRLCHRTSRFIGFPRDTSDQLVQSRKQKLEDRRLV